MLLLLAVAQAVSASPPERVDLTIAQPCREQNGSQEEIVVCASRSGESPYRIGKAPPAAGKGIPKAETSVADGVAVAAEMETVDIGGFPSKRAMIRVKIKF